MRSGSVVQIRNLPFANDNLQLTAKANYRLDNHLKLEASYVHNSIDHSVREVANASDNRFRLQLDANGYDWGTVRVSYEFGSLSGSDYISNPYTSYYSTSLPGYIPQTPLGDPAFTLSDLRKFDVGRQDRAYRSRAGKLHRFAAHRLSVVGQITRATSTMPCMACVRRPPST